MRPARTNPIGWLAVAALALGTPAFGTTVVSDVFISGASGAIGGWQAVTWTQTGNYTNVSIGANLAIGDGRSTGTGTAYLMTQLGPGTTAADEVTTPDAITVSGNPGSNIMTSLFTNLTLGPGTYYLLIDPTETNTSDSLFWDIAGTPLQTLDTGVTQGTDLKLSGGVAGFSPASNSVTESNWLIFSVTGTPGQAPATPEPSSLGLMVCGLAGLAITVRKRTPARR